MNIQGTNSQSSQCLEKKQHSYCHNSIPPYYDFQLDKTSDNFDKNQDKLSNHKNRALEKSIFVDEQPELKIPSVFTASNRRYGAAKTKDLHENIPLSRSPIDDTYLRTPAFAAPESKNHFPYSDNSSHVDGESTNPTSFYNSFGQTPKFHLQESSIGSYSFPQKTDFEVNDIPDRVFEKQKYDKLTSDTNQLVKESRNPEIPVTKNNDFENCNTESSIASSQTPQKEKNEDISSPLSRFPVSSFLPNIKPKPFQSGCWKSRPEDSSAAEDSSDLESSAKSSNFKEDKDASVYKDEDDEDRRNEDAAGDEGG